ncbi:MAG: tail fiber domain-containing protein [Phycisphaerales bacterium]
MRLGLFATIVGGLVVIADSASVTLAGPAPLVYEGRLSYLSAPVDSTADLRFRLFDAAQGDAQIGDTIEIPAATLDEGAFRVTLDFGDRPATAWLEVSVRAPAGEGDYVTLSPRQLVEPDIDIVAGNATRALNTPGTTSNIKSSASRSTSRTPHDPALDPAGAGFDPGAITLGSLGSDRPDDNIKFGPAGVWVSSGANVIYTGGNVGIGTASPSMPLTVDSSTAAQSILATNTAMNGRGITGLATGANGANFGVFGISFSPGGTGVFGQANHATGVNYGVTGTSGSTNGTAVRGLATATTGNPVAVRGVNSGNVGYAGSFLGGKGVYVRSITGTNADSGDLRPIADASVVVEGVDAMLEVISDNSGVVGSVITLKELMPDGTYVDHWAIGRDASESGNSSFMITYETIPNGAQGNHLVIETNGNTGIGRDPTTNRLEVEGNASKTASGSWLANSDRRIKTNIETVTDALDTLDRVRLVSFDYTDDYKAAHPSIADHKYVNVIAQEFAEVFPDEVKGSGERLPDGSEILQVDTYPLTIYSAAAVQELHAIVEQQKTEIASLQSDNESLAAQVEALRADVESIRTGRRPIAASFVPPLLLAAGISCFAVMRIRKDTSR